MSRETILSPAFPSAGQPSSGRPSFLLPVLGAVLTGVSAILFFSANWTSIPDAVKLGMIFSGLSACYGAGFWLKFRSSPRPRPAAGLFMLGAIAFGSGIYLVAQIYNLPVDWRTGVLYWFLGTLPLAYALPSRPVLWISLGTLALWFSRFDLSETLYFHQALGAVLVMSSLLHSKIWPKPGFAKIYFGLGWGMILASTVLMGLDFWSIDSSLESLHDGFGPLLIWLLAAYLLGWAGLLVLQGSSLNKSDLLLMLFLKLALTPALLLLIGNPLSDDSFRILLILLAFAQTIGLLYYGKSSGARGAAKLALGFLWAQVFFRYFDSDWEYQWRSLFFLSGGITLFLLAYLLERQRSKPTLSPPRAARRLPALQRIEETAIR